MHPRRTHESIACAVVQLCFVRARARSARVPLIHLTSGLPQTMRSRAPLAHEGRRSPKESELGRLAGGGFDRVERIVEAGASDDRRVHASRVGDRLKTREAGREEVRCA